MELIYFIFLIIFLGIPFILTIINVTALIYRHKGSKAMKKLKFYECATIILGILYSIMFAKVSEIFFSADWDKVLTNSEVHTPIWSGSNPTVITLFLVGVLGYLVLSFNKVEKMPPLLIVSSMAAMYIGVIECIFWIAQTISTEYIVLDILPFNFIIIVINTIKYKILEWNSIEKNHIKTFKNEYFRSLNEKISNAVYWPILAFIIMLPILGIIICILTLFGQEPNAIIKTWTETSDWNLSQKISPQNVVYDNHYLCTVAAGGHSKIVKPIRMGQRHGRKIIVNRQLCIANAFEQILEEKVPTLHRHIRNFYDKYGFPIAKIIVSKYAADIVYIIMKPLEWFFLIVLYFCDVNPENRIAVQYIPNIPRKDSREFI